MTIEEYQKLTNWYKYLLEIEEEYPDNANLETVIRRVKSRIDFFNKEQKK